MNDLELYAVNVDVKPLKEGLDVLISEVLTEHAGELCDDISMNSIRQNLLNKLEDKLVVRFSSDSAICFEVE